MILTRRNFLRTTGVGLASLAAPSCLALNTVPTRRPNVILIMTDDQGYGDLACHGNPIIKTPNLDKLHSESTRFTNFHVNAFCAPTRASLLTGRMSDRTHVRTTIYSRNHLNRDETTMAEFFKVTGYQTGHFGKWHLGRNYPYRPVDRGFDQWVGHGDGGTGTASDYWGNDKMNDTYWRNGKWEKFSGFCTDIYFDESMQFIENPKDKPFFVYLATNVPHRPWNVPKEWRQPYEQSELDGKTIDFFATISRFDHNLGRLRKFLADKKLDDNTIIVYLTDNGTSGGYKVFNAGMRRSKGSVYEGGHRVPCFVHWPAGGIDKPVDIDRLTNHFDLLPTLIELCSLKTPTRGHLKFDGKSLLPLLRNPKAVFNDRIVFLHSQNVREKPLKWMNSLVMTEQWRLINGEELYDIKADPGQKQNVAEKYPKVVADLRKRYERHWDELNMAANPYPRPIVGSRYEEETSLVPDGWIIDDEKGRHTWNQSHILSGVNNSGFWPVEMARDGIYRFDVRRWPKELNLPVTAALEADSTSDIDLQGRPVQPGKGRAILAVRVELQVGKETFQTKLSDGDVGAKFDVRLPAGPTDVRAWLIDAKGNKRGAYYIYARKTSVERKTHLFILSGQSNMAGLDPKISFTPTVETAFGKDNVIVVKDAKGGQPIRRWYKKWKPAKGDEPKATGDLYDQLMSKVNASIKGKKIQTVTFVWMQGERDAREKHGQVYADSFKGLLDQLREDLGRKDINFVIGRISDFDMGNKRYPHWTKVREAQVEVAEADPHGDWVDTDDLNDGKNRKGRQIKNDLHYSVEGYKTLGKRFAEKSIELIKNNAQQGA